MIDELTPKNVRSGWLSLLISRQTVYDEIRDGLHHTEEV